MAMKPKQGKSAPVRRGNRRWLLLAALIVLGGGALIVATTHDRGAGIANPAAERWALAHWQRPIPPQGPVPEGYLEQAKSLLPEDCGVCHPSQYADWKTSLHSQAMGPGVVGQFPTLGADELLQCHNCHAPMSEQIADVDTGGADADAVFRDNPQHNFAFASHGLVCAACHLREHRRHGPPPREGRPSTSQLAHGEPIRSPHFEASEFCKVCHQHPPDSMLVNGKPVENTYNEWLASPQAAQGIACQQCHMPDRRHQWKGIHDAEMTLRGVTIEAVVTPVLPKHGAALRATLTVTNSGVGHAFPTYTTPAVYLRAAFLDRDDRPIRGTYEEKILQRRLDMSVVPWREAFDTRILPGESSKLRFDHEVPEQARSLYLWIWVDPDQFYNGFFKQMLERGDFSGRSQIEAAHAETVKRQYLLWSKKIAIGAR
jgi:hypothetical protein